MIGKTLSHFRVTEKLGEGGMGVVYKAEDIELRRAVALKVLRPDFVGNEDRRARFLREARTAAKISHPNLATIHEIGEADGETFIAMEFLEGKTLRQYAAGEPVPADEALRIAVQIADGLVAAHRAQVIHRDLKPENIIVDGDGRVKILDFGLAKWIEAFEADGSTDHSDEETVDGLFTREGRILGTVAYMSPEQARGQEVDARSDLFSFGITLYETLTGRSPFAGQTPSDTLAAILRENPPPAVQWNPSVPPELGAVVARCLEKEPDARYASADDLLEDLRRLSGTSSSGSGLSLPPVASKRPGAARSRPRWLNWVAPAAGVAFLLLYMVPRLSNRESGSFAPAPEPVENSLAVMAFENLADPEDPQRHGQILQELIITDLSEHTSLKVFSSQRLFDAAKQVGKGDDETSDRDHATEIARRVGADTILEGSLSRLGDNWILTCQLIDAGEGTVVRSQRIDGTDLYEMVDQLTSRLVTDLVVAIGGEPASVSVREKTTSSLEAYRLYLAGCDLLNRGRNEDAADTLGLAIELDPAFGQAYYKQAMALWWARGGDVKDSSAVAPLERMLSGRLYSSRQERILAEAALELIHQEWEKAHALYRQATEQNPDEKEAWYGLGEAIFHSGSGEEREALAAFEHAIALDPAFALAYPHVFDVYEMWGQHRDAIARVHEIVSQHPDDPVGYRWWVEIASDWGDEDEIETSLAAAKELHPDPADWQRVLETAAHGYRQRDDFGRARELYLEAKARTPKEIPSSVFWGLLSVYANTDELDAAERLVAEVERLHPDREDEIAGGRIMVALGRERFDEAIERSEEALEEHPWDEDYLRHLGVAFVRTGRIDDLESLRDRVLGSGETPAMKARFLRWMSGAFFQKTDYAAAEAWLAAADGIADGVTAKSPGQRLERSWLLAKLGRFDEASAMLRVEGKTPRVEDRLARVIVARERGDLAAAESELHELLATGPFHATLFQLMAAVLLDEDRFEEALPHARRAVEMSGQHTALVMLAWTLVAGDFGPEAVAEGVALLKRAERRPLRPAERPWILPSTPSAEHCLGLAQLKQGNVKAALATLEEAARLRPDRDRITVDIERARALL